MSLVGSIVFILFALPFLAIGIFVLSLSAASFYTAWQSVRSTVHSSVTDPVSPSEAPDSGHAVVTGRVTPHPQSGHTVAPFSGTDAIGYQYQMDQQTDDVGWWTVVDGGYTAPFELEGAVGRLTVDPDGAAPDIVRDSKSTLEGDQELPPRARERLGECEGFEFDSRQLEARAVDEPRRYEEGVLESGETVYVYGKITSGDGVAGGSDSGDDNEQVTGKRIDGSTSRMFRLQRNSPEGITPEDKQEAKSVGQSVFIGLLTLAFGGIFVGVAGSMLVPAVRGLIGI